MIASKRTPTHANQLLSGELMLVPDRTRAVGIHAGTVHVWDAATGKQLQQLKPAEESPNSVLKGLSCSTDSSRIACGLLSVSLQLSRDAQATVWDLSSGQIIRSITHAGSVQVHCTALSPDGMWLATGGQEAGMCVWDLRTGKLQYQTANENAGQQHPNEEVPLKLASQVVSVGFSPDGKTVALADLFGVKLYQAASGELLQTLPHPFRMGRCGLVFSANGDLLARVGTDKQVPIWSVRTGKLIAELPTEAHSGGFSSDGRWFAAGFTNEARGIGVWRMDEPAKPSADNQNARLPWRAHGRVVDGSGKPLQGVTVRAATGIGTLRGGGSGVTDADGRYDFRFGMGIMFVGEEGKPSPQTQCALISARLGGHYEKNSARHGNGIASLEPVTVEIARQWNVEPDQVCLPGKPREVDFVMLPAAKVSGTLVGEDDQPLQDYSVSLTAETLPPGHSVLAQVRTDAKGRFEITEVPTGIPYQFMVRKPRSELKPPWQDSWASGPITFADPGASDLAISISDGLVAARRFVARTLRLKIVGPGVHGKTAVAAAARSPFVAPSDGVRLSADRVKLDVLTVVLNNGDATAGGDKP